MKRYFLLLLLTLAVTVASCSTPPATTQAPAPNTPAAETAPSTTPNPCDKSNVQTSVKQFTDLTREFDDTSYVASFTPQAQLVEPVLKLQEVRRKVQAIEAPDCFTQLKKLQIIYMNGVITALVHFLGGAKGDQVQAEIAATRSLRVNYEQELANVLGVTYVPPPTVTSQPTSAGATEAPPLPPTPTVTPVNLTVIQRANLRIGPGTDFDQVATLNGGETAVAVGRNAQGDWLQIVYPANSDSRAWLLVSLVSVDGAVETLPVVTP